MKKALCLLTLAASSVFADSTMESWDHSHHANITYFKMGGALLPYGNHYRIGPSFALGERFERSRHAIDVSLGCGYFNANHYFIFPKVMYLRYFDFNPFHSLYAGGGLSYGTMKNKVRSKTFEGVLAEGAVGYEWMRDTCIRTFVEFNISQSLLPVADKYHPMSPLLSVSFGVGF